MEAPQVDAVADHDGPRAAVGIDLAGGEAARRHHRLALRDQIGGKGPQRRLDQRPQAGQIRRLGRDVPGQGVGRDDQGAGGARVRRKA